MAVDTQFSCLATKTEESFSDRSASAGIKGVLSYLPQFFGFLGDKGVCNSLSSQASLEFKADLPAQLHIM